MNMDNPFAALMTQLSQHVMMSNHVGGGETSNHPQFPRPLHSHVHQNQSHPLQLIPQSPAQQHYSQNVPSSSASSFSLLPLSPASSSFPDGQCSRTFSLNHPRLESWRKSLQRKQLFNLQHHHHSKEEGMVGGSRSECRRDGADEDDDDIQYLGSKPSTKPSFRGSPQNNIPPVHNKSTISPFASIPPHGSKPTSSNHQISPLSKFSTSSKANNSSNSIPVGIAIGRRRERTDRAFESTSSTMSHFSSSSSSGQQQFTQRSQTFQHRPTSSFTPDTSHDSSNNNSPIPMGYQLAKDPNSGHIILIPMSNSSSLTTNVQSTTESPSRRQGLANTIQSPSPDPFHRFMKDLTTLGLGHGPHHSLLNNMFPSSIEMQQKMVMDIVMNNSASNAKHSSHSASCTQDMNGMVQALTDMVLMSGRGHEDTTKTQQARREEINDASNDYFRRISFLQHLFNQDSIQAPPFLPSIATTTSNQPFYPHQSIQHSSPNEEHQSSVNNEIDTYSSSKVVKDSLFQDMRSIGGVCCTVQEMDSKQSCMEDVSPTEATFRPCCIVKKEEPLDRDDGKHSSMHIPSIVDVVSNDSNHPIAGPSPSSSSSKALSFGLDQILSSGCSSTSSSRNATKPLKRLKSFNVVDLVGGNDDEVIKRENPVKKPEEPSESERDVASILTEFSSEVKFTRLSAQFTSQVLDVLIDCTESFIDKSLQKETTTNPNTLLDILCLVLNDECYSMSEYDDGVIITDDSFDDRISSTHFEMLLHVITADSLEMLGSIDFGFRQTYMSMRFNTLNLHKYTSNSAKTSALKFIESKNCNKMTNTSSLEPPTSASNVNSKNVSSSVDAIKIENMDNSDLQIEDNLEKFNDVLNSVVANIRSEDYLMNDTLRDVQKQINAIEQKYSELVKDFKSISTSRNLSSSLSSPARKRMRRVKSFDAAAVEPRASFAIKKFKFDGTKNSFKIHSVGNEEVSNILDIRHATSTQNLPFETAKVNELNSQLLKNDFGEVEELKKCPPSTIQTINVSKTIQSEDGDDDSSSDSDSSDDSSSSSDCSGSSSDSSDSDSSSSSSEDSSIDSTPHDVPSTGCSNNKYKLCFKSSSMRSLSSTKVGRSPEAEILLTHHDNIISNNHLQSLSEKEKIKVHKSYQRDLPPPLLDEYEFRDEDDDNLIGKSSGTSPFTAQRSDHNRFSATTMGQKRIYEKPSLSTNKITHSSPGGIADSQVCASLTQDDLVDGRRMLILSEGKFWPSRLSTTQLPDIYSVTKLANNGSRGHHRPEIMPRDEVLNMCIREIQPQSPAHLLVDGSCRVCVFWSQAYGQCLFPGTIKDVYEATVPTNTNNGNFNNDTLESNTITDTFNDLMNGSSVAPNNGSSSQSSSSSTSTAIISRKTPTSKIMISVQLDDGDKRQVELSNVRLLPLNYPKVTYDPDPISSMRKRRASSDTFPTSLNPSSSSSSPSCATSSPVKRSAVSVKPYYTSPVAANKQQPLSTISETSSQSNHRSGASNYKKFGRVKLDGSFNNTTTYSIPGAIRSTNSHHLVMRGGSFGGNSLQHAYTTASHGGGDYSGGMHENKYENPSYAKVWTWADFDTPSDFHSPNQSRVKIGNSCSSGGGKKSANTLHHNSILRYPHERISVGDCAVFVSNDTSAIDRPYVGRITSMWETVPQRSGIEPKMMVKVKWFYHPQEIHGGGGKKEIVLKETGGLFESLHTDENSVHTISHKCEVIPYNKYKSLLQNQRGGLSLSSVTKNKQSTNVFPMNNVFFIAGSYDPVRMLVDYDSQILNNNLLIT